VISTAHQQFKEITPEQYAKKLIPSGLIVDVKSILDTNKFASSNLKVWRL
jgi:UDP-N-acetyl-D-mannosaminuronate dehydrogenase